MKLIEIKKKIGDSGRYNTHYINVNYIVEVYEWGNATVIVLNNNEKIECLETLENVLNKIK
jgi:hypothetical protein